MTQRPKILVVDDEVNICEFLAVLLRKSGYDVEACHSGPDALQALSHDRFDMLLTDFVMPRMDGAELIRYARKVQPGIPVIVLTGFGTVDVATKVMQAGADDYVSKPFDVKHLQKVVARYLTKDASAADCDHMLKELRTLDSSLKSRRSEMERRAGKVADNARQTLDELTIQMASARARIEATEAAAQAYSVRNVAQTAAGVAAREMAWPSAAVFVRDGQKAGQLALVAKHNWRIVPADKAADVADFAAHAAQGHAAQMTHSIVADHVLAAAPVVDQEAIAAVCAAGPQQQTPGGEKPLRILQAVADAVAQPLAECLRFADAQIECWQMAERLIATLEGRSRYRENHARRVAEYAAAMGLAIGLSEDAIADLRRGAVLHDVGEIAMAPSILDKADALSDNEVEMMKSHPVAGEEIASRIDVFSPLKKVIRHHHEHWDGRGYPDGLTSEDIPMAARILSLADAFDAITTERPYREAQSPDFAISEIQSEAGKQFDPELAKACAEALRNLRMRTDGTSSIED